MNGIVLPVLPYDSFSLFVCDSLWCVVGPHSTVTSLKEILRGPLDCGNQGNNGGRLWLHQINLSQYLAVSVGLSHSYGTMCPSNSQIL
jgi:hypothetical protein